jgi:hypothetical protein
LPIHSWKLMVPCEVSAVKLGASSFIRNMNCPPEEPLYNPWDSFRITDDGEVTELVPACRQDRHRGDGHPPTPATPPCVRVRTRRFETVTLALIDQGRKSEGFEVRIRKPHSESLGSGERPRATPAACRVAGQTRENPRLATNRTQSRDRLPKP